MTCIVGLVHNGVTYIGGDSLGSNGYSKLIRNDRKVFHLKNINNAILGFTTSYRMGQLLMYANELIDEKYLSLNSIDHEYMVTKFVPNLIQLFDNGHYSRNEDGRKIGGEFLFGYKDKLYKIESDFQVAESSYEFDACGSGEPFALGSLISTKNIIEDPIERIVIALRAASEFCTTVSSPYYVLNTNDKKIIEFPI